MGQPELEDRVRADVLDTLTSSGRELSTAMVLFHTNLSRRVGLGATEEKVLELVQRQDDITVTELAKLAGMAKNTLSDTLDRLEAKGFIERRPHPGDGRKVSLAATAAGVERIGALFAGLMSGLSQLNADYTTDELALIADYQRRAAEIQVAEAHVLAPHTDGHRSGRP